MSSGELKTLEMLSILCAVVWNSNSYAKERKDPRFFLDMVLPRPQLRSEAKRDTENVWVRPMVNMLAKLREEHEAKRAARRKNG